MKVNYGAIYTHHADKIRQFTAGSYYYDNYCIFAGQKYVGIACMRNPRPNEARELYGVLLFDKEQEADRRVAQDGVMLFSDFDNFEQAINEIRRRMIILGETGPEAEYHQFDDYINDLNALGDYDKAKYKDSDWGLF